MSLDIGKLVDNAIADCRTAEDARSVLWFFAGVRDILNAECGCASTVLPPGATVRVTCWPCLLRAARDRES